MADQTPELFDRGLDRNHRSYRSAILGHQLGTFRPRTSIETLLVDDRYVQGLTEAGLITLARLVEGTVDRHDPAKRWEPDRSLLAALTDRWRPETHTFHLPVGEVTITLQDVAYLLGLPLAGDAVGPVDGLGYWKVEISARFSQVSRRPELGAPQAHPHYTTNGPAKAWLMQFTADKLDPDADEYSVRRSFEAYLLWLFGWVMFLGTSGSSVDKVMIHYARAIADADVGSVPQWSWGSAVLAATYRSLCDACTRNEANSLITGCPLLLMLWAAERFAIARPVVSPGTYPDSFYRQSAEDRPTMGTLWCRYERRYAHQQVRRSYPYFVLEFDRLQPGDVVWEPYTDAAIASRAPRGLSSLCERDRNWWMTLAPMVFDICVEPHCPHRVMRQFGLRQSYPLEGGEPTVPRAVHRYTRKGQRTGHEWAPLVQQYVDDWILATEHAVDEIVPHTQDAYLDYLRWFLPRTRARISFTPAEPQPHVAQARDAYPRHRDQDYFLAADAAQRVAADIDAAFGRLDAGMDLTGDEQRSTFARMRNNIRTVIRALTCRGAVDAIPPALAPRPPPRPSTSSMQPAVTPPLHPRGFPQPTPRPTGPPPTVRPPTGFPASSSSVFAGAGSSGAGSSGQQDDIGWTDPPSPFDDEQDDDVIGTDASHDVLGASQLGGAPMATQEQPSSTPLQQARYGRGQPPDRLTYSQGHVRAQPRKKQAKRGRTGGQ